MDKTQEMLSEGSKTKFSKESCSKYVQVLLDILSRIMTNTKVDVYSTKWNHTYQNSIQQYNSFNADLLSIILPSF